MGPHITIHFTGTPRDTSARYELMDFLENNAPRLLGKTREETLAFFKKTGDDASIFLPGIAAEKTTALTNAINRLFPNIFTVERTSDRPAAKPLKEILKNLPPETEDISTPASDEDDRLPEPAASPSKPKKIKPITPIARLYPAAKTFAPPPDQKIEDDTWGYKEPQPEPDEEETVVPVESEGKSEKKELRETKKPYYKLLVYGFNPASIEAAREKAEKEFSSRTLYGYRLTDEQKQKTIKSLTESYLREEFTKKIEELVKKIAYWKQSDILMNQLDLNKDFFEKLFVRNSSRTGAPVEIDFPKNSRTDDYLLEKAEKTIQDLKPLFDAQITTAFKREKKFVRQTEPQKEGYEHGAEELAQETTQQTADTTSKESVTKKNAPGREGSDYRTKYQARGGNSKPRRHDFPRKTIRET